MAHGRSQHEKNNKNIANYLKYKQYVTNSDDAQLNISPSPKVNSNLEKVGKIRGKGEGICLNEIVF